MSSGWLGERWRYLASGVASNAADSSRCRKTRRRCAAFSVGACIVGSTTGAIGPSTPAKHYERRNMMDADQIQSFCRTAAELLTQVGDYASVEAAQHKPEDDALV